MLAAAWLTAAATVGLLADAVITAIYAIRAFGKQSKDVSDQAEVRYGVAAHTLPLGSLLGM